MIIIVGFIRNGLHFTWPQNYHHYKHMKLCLIYIAANMVCCHQIWYEVWLLLIFSLIVVLLCPGDATHIPWVPSTWYTCSDVDFWYRQRSIEMSSPFIPSVFDLSHRHITADKLYVCLYTQFIRKSTRYLKALCSYVQAPENGLISNGIDSDLDLIMTSKSS